MDHRDLEVCHHPDVGDVGLSGIRPPWFLLVVVGPGTSPFASRIASWLRPSSRYLESRHSFSRVACVTCICFRRHDPYILPAHQGSAWRLINMRTCCAIENVRCGLHRRHIRYIETLSNFLFCYSLVLQCAAQASATDDILLSLVVLVRVLLEYVADESGTQKKNRASEYYDTTDPFIDDSELAQDERTFFAQTKQKGFYVSSGQVALLNT